MWKTFGIALLLLMSGATCFAQSTYKGLTPGTSTRADVERTLGRPVKNISSTLVEYSGGSDANKIYVQYESDSATTLRIEVFCEIGEVKQNYQCRELYDKLVPNNHKIRGGALYDARIVDEPGDRWAIGDAMWHPAPYYVVSRFRQTRSLNEQGGSIAEWRIGVYSKELYENAVPKSCTGTILGVWETNRGRITITRKPGEQTPDGPYVEFIGKYSSKGEISGSESLSGVYGQWKDSTGSGTMSLTFTDELRGIKRRRSFEGEWERETGKGPKKGTWTGRCVETN